MCGDKFGFINLLAHGQLGCLHFLAIINITAMNICIKVFVGHMLSFLLGWWVEVGLAGGMVYLCLIFQEITALFSKVATSFYIPTIRAPLSPYI